LVFVPTAEFEERGLDGSVGSHAVQSYQGWECYKFCLLVVCGLRSELLGETEVMGQFKNFLESLVGDSPFEIAFRLFAQALLADAKRVRSEYLQDFGTLSYGRLASQWLQASKTRSEALHIVGRGHLAMEITPWLKGLNSSLTYHVRSTDSGAMDQCLLTASGQRLRGDLIVAAPISDDELLTWMERNEASFNNLVDFREAGQRGSTALRSLFARVLTLDEAFLAVSSCASSRLEKAAQAERAIGQIVAERAGQKLIRPFGWDDLCA
jgi:glutamyl-tRNA reductase